MATAAMAKRTSPSITTPSRTQTLQPAQAEAPRAPAPRAPAASTPNILTDTELAAAQNLVHLSESSSSGSSAEDLNLQGSACSSSSSSPISVNTRHHPTTTTPAEEGTMDWEEQIYPRRQQRYRSIPSLYEVTARMDGIGKQRGGLRSTRSDRNKRNRMEDGKV